MARDPERKRRAERKEETRRRIIESAYELHGTVGFAQATFSAVAERAGVERLTLYRHFPSQRELVSACAAHFYEVYPPPDPSTWRRIRDPVERLRRGLAEVYAHHRRTEGNTANFLRDLSVVPFLPEIGTAYVHHWQRMRDALAVGWGVRGRRRQELLALIGHALDFPTWHSLVRRRGLRDEEAVEAMVRLVRSV